MKRTHVKSKPVNIAKLIDSLGAQRASASLGITPSAIMKYIRVDKAPLATEIAAKMLCTSNTNETAAVIKGDSDLLAAVRHLVRSAGGGFTEIKWAAVHPAF